MICRACYGDVATDVELRDFDGLFVFEGRRGLLIDFSDNVDDFSCKQIRVSFVNFTNFKF